MFAVVRLNVRILMKKIENKKLKRHLIAIVFLLFSAHSESTTKDLVCEGKYINWRTPNPNGYSKDFKGVLVKINENKIKIWTLPFFGSTEGLSYLTTSTSDSELCFENEKDSNIHGCINRFSGEIRIRELFEDPRLRYSGMAQRFFDGVCNLRSKIF